MEHAPATAWAQHRGLFDEAVFLDDIEATRPKPQRERLYDHGPVGWKKPPPQEGAEAPQHPRCEVHDARLSASSIKPSRGTESPRPRPPAITSQTLCSHSEMSSILAKLNVTLAC